MNFNSPVFSITVVDYERTSKQL